MNESDLKKNLSDLFDRRDSKIHTNKGFVSFDNEQQGDTHWNCFYIRDNADSMSHVGHTRKSFYFDSFRGVTDKFLINYLPKAIVIIIIEFMI